MRAHKNQYRSNFIKSILIEEVVGNTNTVVSLQMVFQIAHINVHKFAPNLDLVDLPGINLVVEDRYVKRSYPQGAYDHLPGSYSSPGRTAPKSAEPARHGSRQGRLVNPVGHLPESRAPCTVVARSTPTYGG